MNGPGSSSVAPAAADAAHVANESLAARLDRHTASSALVQRQNGKLRCLACAHRCLLAEGRRGICKVRFNAAGQLRVPFGYVAGVASDPIEKKPFFHVLPGSAALTFGMLGCNLHCAYCQNWISSQTLRDAASGGPIQPATAAQLVAAARRAGAASVVSSYNEPLITAEWAGAVFQEAASRGLICGIVSNGHATPEVIEFLRPWLRCVKVDLKTFDECRYRALGGRRAAVLDTIRLVHARGLWLEVLTLVVPGWNDSQEELRDIARFVASVSPDIPWHVTAFHPEYQMTQPRPTTAADLVRAAEIGAAEGLNFVYAGNLPGRVGRWEDTRCPGCGRTLVERVGYFIRRNEVTAGGQCPGCGRRIPGIWAVGQPSE
mgnify:CR=1 FL=1